jgi:hypothetical protein
MTEDRSATETDVVTKLSRQSVAGTVARLTGMITAVSYHAPAALAASTASPPTWPPASPASTP